MENKKRILDMLEAGKITSDEALKLLSAVEGEGETGGGFKPARAIKYLRVQVDSPAHPGQDRPAKVNVRIPVSLIRAGIKFTSLIPRDAADQVEAALHEKGINLDLKNIKDEDVDGIIDALRELEVDIDGSEGKVKVFAE